MLISFRRNDDEKPLEIFKYVYRGSIATNLHPCIGLRTLVELRENARAVRREVDNDGMLACYLNGPKTPLLKYICICSQVSVKSRPTDMVCGRGDVSRKRGELSGTLRTTTMAAAASDCFSKRWVASAARHGEGGTGPARNVEARNWRGGDARR